MSSAFVPFLKPAAAAAAGPDRATASSAFVALASGAASAAPACAHPGGTPGEPPKVTLQKDGDRVTHIRIQCSCGEIIELDCAY